MTGLDFLRASAGVSHTDGKDVRRVLALVELEPGLTAAQPIGTLSGGQFQRLLSRSH